MKNMSEVFVLPVKSPTWSVTNLIDADNKSVCEFKNRDQAECARNAINHLDALAEALDLLLNDKAMMHVSNDKHLQAKAALAAYRGEK